MKSHNILMNQWIWASASIFDWMMNQFIMETFEEDVSACEEHCATLWHSEDVRTSYMETEWSPTMKSADKSHSDGEHNKWQTTWMGMEDTCKKREHIELSHQNRE